MTTITVRATYPRDLKLAELEPLAAELRGALVALAPDVDVRAEVSDDEHRVGTTFVEIVNLALGATGGIPGLLAIAQAVIGAWMKRRRNEKGNQRPQVANIFGADGRVISTVELNADEDEPRIVSKR